jgi:tryptophanyl-tRNA synthetase
MTVDSTNKELDNDSESDSNIVKDFVVTPWEVEGDIDYSKLIVRFGTHAIDDTLLEKINYFTGEIHPFLKNRYFFSHRDLDLILDEYKRGNKFYLYTGRGPSGLVHLGHLMPWLFTKYLQEKFDVNLIFQLTDDEKFLFNSNLNMETIQKYT